MAYRKLRASRNGFGSSSRLYLGEDHILSVESNVFTEKYFRFYFSDIQGIIVRRTDRGAIWSVVLGFVALLMTTCSIGSIPPGEWAPTPGYLILALTAAAIMLVNLVKGPSCATHIQTSVTVQKVGALHRLKKTEEILPEIRSHIRAVQGSLTREEISRRTVMPEEEISTEEGAPGEQQLHEHEQPLRDPTSFHRFAFAAVLVNGGLNILWFFISGLTVYITGALGAITGFCGVIAALIVQNRKNTSAAIRKLTWAAFTSYLAVFIVSYALNIYYMVRSGIDGLNTNKGFDPFSFYTDLVDKGPLEKKGLLIMVLISIVLYLTVGISGLAAVGLRKNDSSQNRQGRGRG